MIDLEKIFAKAASNGETPENVASAKTAEAISRRMSLDQILLTTKDPINVWETLEPVLEDASKPAVYNAELSSKPASPKLEPAPTLDLPDLEVRPQKFVEKKPKIEDFMSETDETTEYTKILRGCVVLLILVAVMAVYFWEV